IFAIADHGAAHSILGGGPADAVLAELAGECARANLKLVLDVVASRVAVDGKLAREHPDWFRPLRPSGAVDPRVDPEEAHVALAPAKFDGVFSSLPWWDRRASWFVDEHELLRRVAPVLACPEAPFDERLAARLAPGLDLRVGYAQALRIAAATGSGMLVPMGFE